MRMRAMKRSLARVLAFGAVMAALCGVVPAATTVGATQEGKAVHFPPVGPRPAGVPQDSKPPFSSSVLVGDTLYIAGVMDIDPATGKPGTSRSEQARLVLDALSRSLKAAGLVMDDLVWVQVFATDLASFDEFGAVYSGYFKGPLPARSFVGVAGLMGGAHFELNGIAVRKKAGP
jgi:2-iminobutanoate/2-iminopropanoate deaminase